MESQPTSSVGSAPIPAAAGIGLRAPHYKTLLASQPSIAWLELHSENFFAAGGKSLYFLEQIRQSYPLSFHGVGLSIGSADPLNKTHLQKLKQLISRFQPALVSEHICWGSVGGHYLNDLLPLPYTEEALQHMVERVSQVQDYLGRQLLLENVSSYLQYEESNIAEWEFVAALAERADCAILLDINNIYVNACNHGFTAETYLNAIPKARVQELHLAGFSVNQVADSEILIDTHSRPVCAEVWALYAQAIQRFGAVATLIEWDSDIPELAVLLAEADKAEAILETERALVA